MSTDFSSMSEEEKKGYLKALGIDRETLQKEASESGLEARSGDEKMITLEKEEFTKKEIFLLQKDEPRVRGALSTTFHSALRASLVDVRVDKQVKVALRCGSSNLEPENVRRAIKDGLAPCLQDNELA